MTSISPRPVRKTRKQSRENLKDKRAAFTRLSFRCCSPALGQFLQLPLKVKPHLRVNFGIN